MKITYLHQYYYTRKKASNAGNRSYEFGRRLAKMGHEVNVITSLTDPKPDSPKTWFCTHEEGMNVHWLPVPYSNKMAFQNRIRSFLRFAAGSALKAASIRGDVIYATSGPLTIAIPALYASWRQKVPLVFEVRDLWPEGAIQLGLLTNPIAIRMARWLERLAYRRSRHIVALSPGMKMGILIHQIPEDKVTVIPNASDIDLFSPDMDGRKIRNQLSLNDRFVIGFFGTMGMANGVGFVLDAAVELQKRRMNDVVFLLLGDGMERAYLEKRASIEKLDNVVFIPPVPKEQVPEFVAASDVCLAILKNVPALHTCSPNKVFDAFAAGKPLLTNIPGWVSELVVKRKTGCFVEPDNPQNFVEKIIYMKKNPMLLKEFSKNARQLAENEFSRDLLASNLEKVLLNAAVLQNFTNE